MDRLLLSSNARTDFSKSETKRLRREGLIPATVYGKDIVSQAIAVPSEEFNELLKVPGARLSLIDLAVDGKTSESHPVMIQKLQRDLVTKIIIHVDFHRVSMTEAVHSSIPIMMIGEAPGAKLGGILEQVMQNLEIKALPGNVPTHIDVDISNLEIGDSIHVSDLCIPADVEISGSLDEAIVVAVRGRMGAEEEEEVAPAAEEAAPAAAE